MKQSRISSKVIMTLPVLCVVTSVGIVAQQSARRDRLKTEIAASEREYATLEKRVKELRKATGRPTSDAAASDGEAHRHDGDGD